MPIDRVVVNASPLIALFRILGTGGALILAKRRGLIGSVSESLTALRNAGLWLSDELVHLLQRQAGEA